MAAIESAEVIRDLVRDKINAGEWTAADAMGGLQTVFTLVALDAGVPLEVVLECITVGYHEAERL